MVIADLGGVESLEKRLSERPCPSVGHECCGRIFSHQNFTRRSQLGADALQALFLQLFYIIKSSLLARDFACVVHLHDLTIGPSASQ